MRTVPEWLDRARERAGLPSDYALAKALHVTPQAISMMRSASRGLSETVAERLGVLCGVEGGIIYAEAQASRAKRTEVREFWVRVARGLAAVLVVGVLGVFVGGVVQVAEASALSPSKYYAHLAHLARDRRRRRRARVAAHLVQAVSQALNFLRDAPIPR